MAYDFDRVSINWENGGGFALRDWLWVYRKVIQAYQVETVLEYGCGLSTELMVAVGLRVLSLETQSQFAEIYQAGGFEVVLCDYEEGYPKVLPDRWHLGFVDGPGEKERHDRSKSVLHAMQYCSLIYLHDYNLDQFGHLDNSREWAALTEYNERQNHLYVNRRSSFYADAQLVN